MVFGVEWSALASDFRSFHTHPLNVALHLVTTPAALIGGTVLLAHYCGQAMAVAVHIVWMLLIIPSTPSPLWVTSAAVHTLVCLVAAQASLSTIQSVILLVVGYFMQDVAHLLTCEPTFQSSYQGSVGWLWRLLQHTLHLVPLCVDACWHTKYGSLAYLVTQRQQVVFQQLGDKKQLFEAVEAVGKWALDQKPVEHQTTHWWVDDLAPSAAAAFRSVARSDELRERLFGSLFPSQTHVVEALEGMNEVYVACKTFKTNSDQVFYTNHVDGPYGIFPFVKVYRAMLGCTHNEQIRTCFPLAGQQHTLSVGEIAAFDFHREVHRIEHVPGSNENEQARVCMKIHFLIYPRALAPIGRLMGRMSVRYNANFRNLFLFTIDPNSMFARVSALSVLVGTFIFNRIEMMVGWSNILYLLTAAAVALVTRSYTPFFYMTSFVHYAVYAGTYHQRTAIAFGAFKRDALLYKTLALIQASIQFATLFDFANPSWDALGLLAAGFGPRLTHNACIRLMCACIQRTS